MNPIRNILVIVDPTAQEHPAVTKAALLAEKLDARVELFVCDTKASRQARMAVHAQTRAHEPFLANVKVLLESLAQPLRARGIDVTTEVECADPLHIALIDRTRRTSAELVVKDTHHHSLAQRTFLTNTDWQLIRSCPVALLLTKATQWSKHPRILAAVDPSHTNDKPEMFDHHILEHASVFAERLEGELHAVHVYLPMATIAAATVGTPPIAAAVSAEDLAAEERAKRREVAAVVANYGIAPGNIHLQVGGPAEFLPRIAGSLHADIMAMGAISRSGLKRIFIGSTAEDVLEHLPCDGLIVKPPNFAELLPF